MLITGGEGNEEKDTGTCYDSSTGIYSTDWLRIDRVCTCCEGRDDDGAEKKETEAVTEAAAESEKPAEETGSESSD